MTNTRPFLPPSKGDQTLWDSFDVPFGSRRVDVVALSDGEAITGLSFGPGMVDPRAERGWIHDPIPLSPARDQLRAYASGELQSFEVPIRPSGTEFQMKVWAALMDIPFGFTRSYGDVATSIGRTGAGRAVGSAVGANPIAIVIPCHRVIGSDGSLTGYGGGLENKVSLLVLEGAISC
jgi:methylated-DNA-[protein]-cysteine S-methyltransferase